MNRKFLYGCLGTLGLLAVVGLVVLYVYVLRPTKEIMGDLRQLGALTEMNAQVTDQTPFVPPEDGALTADQLERFARVQASMRLALGSDYAELDHRAQQMRGWKRREDGSLSRPGFRDVIDSFKGLGPLLERAKNAQVDALNEAGFSYPEYRWVRETIYTAMGRENADLYLEEFAERVMGLGEADDEPAGGNGAPADTAAAEGINPLPVGDSPRNRILAAAFADSMALWEPFLVFGL